MRRQGAWSAVRRVVYVRLRPATTFGQRRPSVAAAAVWNLRRRSAGGRADQRCGLATITVRTVRELSAMVVTEGMELVIMFFVIMLNLLILVWLQKWSGLT